MRFTSRSSERKAMAELLEHGEYESYEDMASAVLQLAVDLLAERQTRAVLAKFPQDDTGLVYGPYYHADDVKKASQKAQEAGLETRSGLLLAPARWEASEALRTACACGHEKEQHVVKVRNGVVGPPQECGVFVNKKRCACTNYQTERKAA